MSRIDRSLMIPLGEINQTSSIGETAIGTKSSETQAKEKALQSTSLTKLSFATSVDATRTLLKSASCLSIWLCCTSSPRDAKHLRRKGLKLTSTFIHVAMMELVLRMMFLLES